MDELRDALLAGEFSDRQEVGYLALGDKDPEPREVVATPVSVLAVTV